jgi:predicted RNA-binding Zn-ribbon protein involved in translation (DUF1610 family)
MNVPDIQVSCPACGVVFVVWDPHVEDTCPECKHRFIGVDSLVINKEAIAGCWRCDGKGIINVDSMVGKGKTPCGACLGIMKPSPCPSCGSAEVKCASDGMSVFWRCRDCGYSGPTSLSGVEALKLYNKVGG